MRKPALNPEFVRFFEENVIGHDPGPGIGDKTGANPAKAMEPE